MIESNREKLVRQGTFWWKQLNRLLGNAKYQVAHLNSKQLIKFLAFMVGGLIFVALWCWHWQLLLATCTGIGLMFMAYWLQVSSWQADFSSWLRLFPRQYLPLTVAVSSGAIGALMTYISAHIWTQSENRWLAVGSILQGGATLVTLVLLSWHLLTFKTRQVETTFEENLRDLTAEIPLKRLIAVRKFTKLLTEQSLTANQLLQVREYLRVMLRYEPELIIQEAIWTALQVGEEQGLKFSDQPLAIPLQDLRVVKDYHE